MQKQSEKKRTRIKTEAADDRGLKKTVATGGDRQRQLLYYRSGGNQGGRKSLLILVGETLQSEVGDISITLLFDNLN